MFWAIYTTLELPDLNRGAPSSVAGKTLLKVKERFIQCDAIRWEQFLRRCGPGHL